MLEHARTIADYQFGRGAGQVLFPDGTTYQLSKTRRLRYLFCGKLRLATLRAQDGFFTLSMLGAERLHALFLAPRMRVVAADDAVPFVQKGGNLFARHVVYVDPDIRAGEEVLVVDGDDRLIGIGKAALAPEEMLQIKRGMAVQIRYGSVGK
ncbi:MAG: tRNA-guanine(15) transglycosylase [Methanosaeta sp. PtaB.Bin039]|nr:MAG: tRNA-guanine(15) transglycosylase [Methanosaeta sp. PtaB.Bin039]HOT06773.1 pseudouridine synthase [Methanotrichaceae archaeon]HQF15970.1 pseudouridine synthase [Methanotrichaceae archaeon]HQI90682.1 pseudouridine synthase [Methanotrichaceae archaeon]HQJ28039.1 pseudouridine synthase [Methanotrichaceae archaeon]